MWILVDGYNVAFALGLVPAEVKRGDLQQARTTLLKLLADGLGPRSNRCTVVFDATRSPPRNPGDTSFKGIEVRYTQRREEADDLIAWLVQQCSAPKQLTVISSDRQLVEAATRRKATSVKADQFLEWLERQHQPPAPPATAPMVDPAERESWVKTFEHLDDELREEKTFPEDDWQRRFQILPDDDLRDVRKEHRMKPDEGAPS